MEGKHHVEIIDRALGSFFAAPALQEIIRANLAQDALVNQLGTRPHFHFDDNKIAESLAYVESEHARIRQLAGKPEAGPAQRAALGRLTHAVQDFYAHSNYVDLWLAANGGLETTTPEQIDALDPALLEHPDLRSGYAIIWRDFVYYIPLLGPLMRRIYVAPDSHEAMNLDHPKKGPKFAYAMEAACQRTLHEYRRAAQNVQEAGGEQALRQFQQRAPGRGA